MPESNGGHVNENTYCYAQITQIAKLHTQWNENVIREPGGQCDVPSVARIPEYYKR